jgi:NAD(P)-dependent dehydrogenase (short-subunit alcohol dehydrogenase family)
METHFNQSLLKVECGFEEHSKGLFSEVQAKQSHPKKGHSRRHRKVVSNMKFRGKVAVITGGARGLGRAYALHLAKLGADIAIADINLESASEVGEKLEAATVMEEISIIGRSPLAVQVDVGKKKDVESMFHEVIDRFGYIDILINNAGGLLDHPESSFASKMEEEDLKATLDRNLMGTIYCCQAVGPLMKARGAGKIINVGSLRGLRAAEEGWYASYGISKAAVIHYTRYLALELGPYGINVNCIIPGHVYTKRMAKRWDENREEITTDQNKSKSDFLDR